MLGDILTTPTCMVMVALLLPNVDLREGEVQEQDYIYIPYLLDQMLLSISRRSKIEAAPPDVLKEIVAALEY